MRRLKSVVRLDRGGGSLGGRGVAVGEVRPKVVGVIVPWEWRIGEPRLGEASTWLHTTKVWQFFEWGQLHDLHLKAFLEPQKPQNGFAQRWHSGIASNRGRRCIPSD
jgi:hypothetical protein